MAGMSCEDNIHIPNIDQNDDLPGSSTGASEVPLGETEVANTSDHDGGADRPLKFQRSDPTDSASLLNGYDSGRTEECDNYFYGNGIGDVLKSDDASVDPDEIEIMAAREMASLTMEDREKVYFDIHGVSDKVDETSQLLEDSFKQLRLELAKLDDASAYNTALNRNATFVEDKSFCLRCLRAESFDAEKAAQLIGRYFELKLELFGVDLLTKHITQDDLDKETMDVVYSGKTQNLPERDRAGRLVVVNFAQSATISIDAKLRAMFYLSVMSWDDEESQRKGYVGISYFVGEKMNILRNARHNREWSARVARLQNATPNKLVGLHICYDSFKWRILVAAFKLASHRAMRVRMREHNGDRDHCLLSLQSFGIPTSVLPMDPNGEIQTSEFVEGLEKQRIRERIHRDAQTKGSLPVRISVPSRNDVLLGRGKAAYSHMGNVKLRSLVEEKSIAYEEASLPDKQQMNADIVILMHESSGRFLEDDGAGWVEVSDTLARRKVAHAFRSLRQVKVVAETND